MAIQPATFSEDLRALAQAKNTDKAELNAKLLAPALDVTVNIGNNHKHWCLKQP